MKDPSNKANMLRFFKKEKTSTNNVAKLGHKTKNQIGKNPTITFELITNN